MALQAEPTQTQLRRTLAQARASRPLGRSDFDKHHQAWPCAGGERWIEVGEFRQAQTSPNAQKTQLECRTSRCNEQPEYRPRIRFPSAWFGSAWQCFTSACRLGRLAR